MPERVVFERGNWVDWRVTVVERLIQELICSLTDKKLVTGYFQLFQVYIHTRAGHADIFRDAHLCGYPTYGGYSAITVPHFSERHPPTSAWPSVGHAPIFADAHQSASAHRPCGCGICADPIYAPNIVTYAEYAVFADGAHLQMYPHGQPYW